MIDTENFRPVLENAIERSEVLKRRFRHCAARSLMILRQYMGRKKSAGKLQMGSRLLFSAVKRLDQQFSILKEARREVLEDVMDYEHALEILGNNIALEEMFTEIPSPFAIGLIVSGHSDVIKIEDKHDFVRRMHHLVRAKIALKEGKKVKN